MGEETRAAVRAIEMVERKDRVLIVEDEDNARKGYEQLLQRGGCDVVGVGPAEEALAKFASYQPDTLIADVELPGMNGLDLLKQRGTELQGAPALVITGKGNERRAVEEIEPGGYRNSEEPLIGCFELADSGTLLLDEIGEMPAPTQAKLLRVLEDRKVRRLGSKSETPVDVRVIAATNKEPEQAVSSGQLRQDLYFRLNVFHIHLPPLREHKEDISLLVDYILRDVNTKHSKHVRGIGAEVLDIFMGHTWPGNIRELRNVLERAAIMCEKDLITRSCLPGEFGKTGAKGPGDLSAIKFPVGTTVDAMERELILQTLGATGNNKTRAAELLGISLKTLHNKLKEYGGDRAEAE